MTAPLLLYPLPGNEARAQAMALALQGKADARVLSCAVHTFPDGESLVRVGPPPPGSQAVLVCSLNQPDARTVPLLMAADTLRELGVLQVGLVAPYLAYMRQDIRFQPGQAVSARLYARLLCAHFDWLLAVDPHLHRIHDLSEVYNLRSRVLHAAPRMAQWIKAHVDSPLIVGPDGESAQWAADVAARADAPVVVVQKTRLGDTEVRSTIPDLHLHPGRTPVLIDDIISSGRTLVAALDHLRAAGSPPPVCVAVHGLFAGDALSAIRAAGAAQIAVANTVDGVSAPGVHTIALDADLAQGVLDLCSAGCTQTSPHLNKGLQP
ncbi:MAG: ribose-phosphate diphosphokinase [Thiomonas sp.]|nr:ribose-phosphate diphosphokinase [Thiomonas sp.]